jgi:hypothetical protein
MPRGLLVGRRKRPAHMIAIAVRVARIAKSQIEV